MADIDSILAGIGGNTRADFSGIGDIPKAYWEGKDQKAKNDLRDAFKEGVPLTPDGQPDFGAMAKTLFQKGGLNEGTAAANLGLGQQTIQQNREGANFVATGGQAAQAPIVSPPSANRTATAVVAPPLNKGGVQGQAPDPSQVTPKSYLTKLGLQPGYNMEVGLAAFKRNGIEPDQTFNPNDPNLAKVMPAMQRMGSIGQVQPQGDGQAPQVAQAQPPQVAQAQPPQGVPQGTPQQPVAQTQQSPFANAVAAGLIPSGVDPTRYVAGLKYRAAALPKGPGQESIQKQVDAINKVIEPTTEMKNASTPGLLERQGEQAAQQAGAVEAAKGYVTKYNNIDEAGTKAIQEIPKLQLALKQMDSPDFQSGSGQRFDLAYRRLAVRLGGDPDKAAPQEIVSKVIADSVLNGLGSLKGLGPIRVAEMNLARTAAMSMDNTPQTNKFLANVAIRIQQRAVEVSDMAQNYNDGVLDVGFDKKLREMDKKNPLFTPDEVERFHKIIGGEEKYKGKNLGPLQSPASQQATMAAFPNAKQAPDGNFYVPDPSRPGKYQKVVQ